MRAILFAFVFIAMAGAAHAQVPESRGTISAIGGFGKTLDDEGSLGRGWLWGVAVDRTIFGTTRAELSFEALSHDRNSGFFQSNGTTWIGALSLVHRFGTGQAQPYLLGGITVGHHSGTNVFNGSPVPLAGTDAGLRFGGGVAIRVNRRVEISPEVRFNGFFIDNDSDPATLPSFGIRLGWRM